MDRIRTRKGGSAPVLFLTCFLAAAPQATAALHDTELVSRSTVGAKGNGYSGLEVGALSQDGRYVVFMSQATNLHPDDGDAITDIYVRDRLTGTTTLVSRATGGAKGNGESFEPTITPDGRYVAFSSESTNLDPDDADVGDDVYIRDLQTDTLILASRNSAATKANGESNDASLSADGTILAFASEGINLDAADTDGAPDIFVRDLVAGTTELVSRENGPVGGEGGAGSHTLPSISADGRYVAYSAGTDNLDPADTDTEGDVLVRDLQTDTNILASRNTAGAQSGAVNCGDSPRISADGTAVAFVCQDALDPLADGNLTPDVYVRDLQVNTTTLVSRATGPAGLVGGDESFSSDISSNGDVVSFSSFATNLSADDGDAIADVFVRNLPAATTTLVSRATGATGVKGNGTSNPTAISPDGLFVAFASEADNLHPDDADATSDAYVRQIAEQSAPPPPGPGPDPGPTPAPTPEPDPEPIQELPPPVLGVSVNVGPLAGTVLVRLPGSGEFVELKEGQQVPTGTVFDTRDGYLILGSATEDGGVQIGVFWNGRFKVTQGEKSDLTTLKLVGPLLGCGPKSSRKQQLRKPKKGNGVWGNTDGNFTSQGGQGSATSHGTTWLIHDRCDGSTLTRVTEGVVRFVDFARDRSLLVRAGERAVARPLPRRPSPGNR